MDDIRFGISSSTKYFETFAEKVRFDKINTKRYFIINGNINILPNLLLFDPA